jgi:hypothetical protein
MRLALVTCHDNTAFRYCFISIRSIEPDKGVNAMKKATQMEIAAMLAVSMDGYESRVYEITAPRGFFDRSASDPFELVTRPSRPSRPTAKPKGHGLLRASRAKKRAQRKRSRGSK